MVVNTWHGKPPMLLESPGDIPVRSPYMPFLPGDTWMSQPENVSPMKIAETARTTRQVFVRDLRLEAHIGVYAHEQDRTQPIRVNVDLTVEEAPHGDSLANVVCYETVVNEIKAIVAQGHLNLVETLAEQIASQCLKDERVRLARIRVEKLAAITEAASVGVEIERAK